MNKTALVTGAASGIGLELSLLLAVDSYNLILVDIDMSKLLEAKTIILRTCKRKIKCIVKDLSNTNSAIEVFSEIQVYAIDVLINNAGFGVFGRFSCTDWLRESQMLNLHVVTTTHLTKLVLPQMLRRNSGMILNVASLAAFQPGPLMALYYASKAYVLSFSEAIANELSGTGVSITVLCPGQTKTAFQKTVSKTSMNTTNDFYGACPKKVAKYGYDAMLKGKTVVIPGRLNKIVSVLPRFISRNFATAMVRKIQEKNRRSA